MDKVDRMLAIMGETNNQLSKLALSVLVISRELAILKAKVEKFSVAAMNLDGRN